jgi:hypothetical protein
MKKILIFSVLIALAALSSCKDTLPSAPQNTGVPGLVAWYKLDQNAADSSGNGHDGVMQGGTFVPDRFGNAQSAFSLDGQSSFISVTNSGSMNFDSASSYSLSVWIKTTSSLTAGIIGKGPVKGTLPGYSVGMNNGSAEVLISSVDNIDILSTTKINDNIWHLLTLTVDSHNGNSDIFLYVDGVLDTKTVSIGTFPDRGNASPFFIGKDRTSTAFFAGSVDDIRVYSKALSGSDVINLFVSGGWATPIDTTTTGGGGGTGSFVTDSLPNSGFLTTLASFQHLDNSNCPPWQVAYGGPIIEAGLGSDGATKGYLYMWGTSDDGCAVWEPLTTPIKKGHVYHIKSYLRINSVDLHSTPYANVRFVAFNTMPSGMHWQTSPGEVASFGSITISKLDSWDPYITLDWTADANYSNFEIDVSNGNSGAGTETWAAIDNIQIQEKQ